MVKQLLVVGTLFLATVLLPNVSASLSALCKAEHSDEVMGELCGAKAEADALLERLEVIAERVVPEFGMQKRKNEFVRFGRSGSDDEADDPHGLSKRKNEFVRFGKRKNEFVRFGKRNPEKRKNEFVRFG